MWLTRFSFLVHSRTSASASFLCMLAPPLAVGHGKRRAGLVELGAQPCQLALRVLDRLETVLDGPDPAAPCFHPVVELVELVLQSFDLIGHSYTSRRVARRHA